MQTDSLEFDPQESQWRYRWWKSSLVWTTLIVTAFLVYEITARPIWGVVVLCSKFGWGDFLAAFFGFWHAIRSRLRVWLPYPHYIPKNAEEDNIAVEVLRALMLAIGFGCF